MQRQNRDLRAAILTLREQGHSARAVARALGISKNTVKRVLCVGSVDPPPIERANEARRHALEESDAG